MRLYRHSAPQLCAYAYVLDIDIVDLPEAYYAVISYSGSASDKNFKKHFDELKVAVDRDKLKISEMPIKATYNSPFTLPFLRRNEAMFPLDWN